MRLPPPYTAHFPGQPADVRCALRQLASPRMHTADEPSQAADIVGSEWAAPYQLLRRKWSTIPYDAQTRMESRDLLQLGDRELLEAWDRAYHGNSTGPHYGIRGWYHDLYRAELSGRKVLDLGCGMAVVSSQLSRRRRASGLCRHRRE